MYASLKGVAHEQGSQWSTHEHMYTFTISAAYFSGLPAALTMILLYFLNGCVLFYQYRAFEADTRLLRSTATFTVKPPLNCFKFLRRAIAHFIFFLVFGFGITIIYILYAFGFQKLSKSEKILFQFFTALVTYAWNTFVVPLLVQLLTAQFNMSKKETLHLHVGVVLYSAVIAPAFGIALADPSCKHIHTYSHTHTHTHISTHKHTHT